MNPLRPVLTLLCTFGVFLFVNLCFASARHDQTQVISDMRTALDLVNVGTHSEAVYSLKDVAILYDQVLDPEERQMSLEAEFKGEYSALVKHFVYKINRLVGVFGDSLAELENPKHWLNEHYSEFWTDLNPHRWFVGQWSYLMPHLNSSGLKFASAASNLSTTINILLFEIREALPLNQQENVFLNKRSNGFFSQLVDEVVQKEFVGFSEDSIQYLQQRGPFLNFFDQIQVSRAKSCSKIISSL